MKTLKRAWLLPVVAMLLFAMSHTACSKDEQSAPEILSDQISKVTLDAIEFIDKAIIYETTIYNPNAITIEEVNIIFNDFFDAGEAFAKSLGDLLGNSGSKSIHGDGLKDDALECVMAPVGEFDFFGLSPGLAIKIGNIIKDAKNAREAIDKAYENGELDELEYWEAIEKIPHDFNINIVNMTGATIGGAGAGALTGYAIVQSSGVGIAGAIGKYGLAVTVGAPVAVGVGTAYGLYRLFSWYTSTDKSGDETVHLVSFPWEFDVPIPAFLFGENAKIAISMDDYAPILIENLILPQDDYNIRIEFEAIPFDQLDSKELGAKSTFSEVCFYQEPVQPGENCDDVMFVVGEPIPPSPAAYQGVTVVATLMPVTQGCDIHFSIIGTDGYSNSATHSSNHLGQASFYIPGAMPGVFDKVTITSSNGASHTVSYYFGGSAKEFDPETITPRR